MLLTDMPMSPSTVPRSVPWDAETEITASRWALGRSGRTLLTMLGLVIAGLIVYAQTTGFKFIGFDDPYYVTGNSYIQRGFNSDSLQWALTSFYAANWHPLTWLSLMLDHELYGLNPGGYHLTNILLHLGNILLLFVWLRTATGALGRAALVALLFAIHPLHVESVAWVSERKDVLSTFFFLLTLLAYTKYGQGGNQWFLAGAAGFYAVGLTAKPMLVTLPAVLLLMDFWPLRRCGQGNKARSAARLIGEKVPFILLSAATCVVTVLAQRAGGAVAPLANVPIHERGLNAFLAYGNYTARTLVPGWGTSVFYPQLAVWPAWQLAGSGALLAGVSWLAWRERQRRPYLGVGWCWFVGTLIPVIGIVQVGSQFVADRYVYLPHIGLFIALCWSGGAWAERLSRGARWGLTVGVALWIGALALVARDQAACWRDAETLYQSSLKTIGPNLRLYQLMGDTQAEQGDFAGAERWYLQAIALGPRETQCYTELGFIRIKQGRWQEAVDLLAPTLGRRPNDYQNFNNFGYAASQLGQREEEAIRAFTRCLELRPDYAPAHTNLAEILAARGDIAGAATHYERGAAFSPQAPALLLRAAWLHATGSAAAGRDGTRALELVRQAEARQGGESVASLDCRAAALAELGRWVEATDVASRSWEMARAAAGDGSVEARERRGWHELYQTGRPLRLP